MPDLIPSKKFIKAMETMSDEDKKRVIQAMKKLQKDPRHNSLRTKKVKALTNIFESRVTSSMRILWEYYEDKILLILVGGHEIVEY
jgi:mRNA-degrading endonuclease RelE of RelBE toxin-antitoxin system